MASIETYWSDLSKVPNRIKQVACGPEVVSPKPASTLPWDLIGIVGTLAHGVRRMTSMWQQEARNETFISSTVTVTESHVNRSDN